MSQGSASRIFGTRKELPILILARGEDVRHMRVRPWMTATALCLVGLLSLGYLAATAYLVLRDDLIGGTMARQARMQHDYEDRISALRAQVDRVTSRQLLDQQVVEDKVETLLKQQQALSSRHGRLGSLIERAEDSGLSAPRASTPAFSEDHAGAGAARGVQAIERLIGLKPKAQETVAALGFAPAPLPGESISDRADRMFSKVTLSLKDLEREQQARIAALTEGARDTADEIETIVARTGLKMTVDAGVSAPAEAQDAVGGPYVAPRSEDDFDRSLVTLDTALERLEAVRGEVRKLPFDNPAPQSEITSSFGNRLDPFLGRLALHAGIDFRLGVGSRVAAAAPGRVIVAGRNGGYGNMVEIDHGRGVTTRYAHLSTILVNVGDVVKEGDPIAKSGSTGRSTGPHLHYEIRLNGEAVDPMRFLNAGLKLKSYVE